MTSRLMSAAFARPAFTILVVLVAAAFGAVSFQQLRRDVFPDLSAPVFNVIVQNPAMGAEELEAAVAIPMETALAGLPDVRRIRSSSQLGVSQVTVEFEADADYYRARQLVAERIGQVATQLPPGTDAPLLSSLTGRLNEILEFTLEAEAGAVDLMTLRDLAEFEVKNRLLAVPGVAAVERLGGYLRQFQIQLDPDADVGAERDARRSAARRRGRQRQRVRRVRDAGRHRVGGARRRPRPDDRRTAHDGRRRQGARAGHARRHRRRARGARPSDAASPIDWPAKS